MKQPKKRKPAPAPAPISTRPLLCVMLVNANCGFAADHGTNCAATIKIGKGQFSKCDKPDATKHVAVLSQNGGSGEHVAHCMNTCSACAKTLSERGDVVVHDAVYAEQAEVKISGK